MDEKNISLVDPDGDPVKRKDATKFEFCWGCFGFCEFLSTSWKLFKEFSADTSIHGNLHKSSSSSTMN